LTDISVYQIECYNGTLGKNRLTRFASDSMNFLRKYSSTLAIVIALGIVIFYLGFESGERSAHFSQRTIIINLGENQPKDVDFGPFWKAWNILEEKYVPASSTIEVVTNEEKVWGAIQGLASSLKDPYTVFFPPVEAELFESDIRGNFEGVGMEVVAREGVIVVVSPLRNSPAERAGILAGDGIVKINGKETLHLSTDQAVKLIRGPKGTKVVLTIYRNGQREPIEIPVTREVINIPTISTKNLNNDIFLIELYSFSAQSPNLFRNALREFILSSKSKLILDLRGNPGGYLEAAIDMASWFLPPGRIVVREDFGEAQEERIYRSKGYNIFSNDLNLVILVDSGSASASEILAGALREYGKATIVGDRTFGKGSVQELVNITSSTSLKVTVARWLTPNGISISDGGITPDVIVRRIQADRDALRDPQLDKAIEILNGNTN
jgi:carboxyl-terminal processing protease